MVLDDNDPKQEMPPEARERKLSTSSEPRLRTRSFSTRCGEVKLTHTVREYVGDGMDGQLKELDLVKKTIPADNTSIFRAVCEQIASVQTDHHELRLLVEKILDPIARRHYANKEFEFNRDKSRFEILAEITNSCIKVYRFGAVEPSVYTGTEAKENRVIQVCETPKRGVYDSVYSANFHEGLAISQSITYRILYEGVFKCSKNVVNDMINFIRRDNDIHGHSTLDQIFMLDDHHMHSVSPCIAKPPKFPFCACKSLDPTMYRNVEFSIYKKKADESVQATMNSMAVKYAHGTRCQARDGNHTGIVRVLDVLSSEVRRVCFEDNPQIIRVFNVSDLRPLAAQPVTHNSMQTLMNETGRGVGGRAPMSFLPGCGYPPVSMAPPHPFAFPPPAQFVPQPPAMNMRYDRAAPPPPSPYYSPPPMMHNPQFFPDTMSLPQQQMQQKQPPPPPPPTPIEKEKKKIGCSPVPVDSPLDNSVFIPSTPLSSRKGEDGGKKGIKKPRAMSAELTDSPTTARSKKPVLPWSKQQQLSLKVEADKKTGERRSTEGDTVGVMNRPLKKKMDLKLHSLANRSISSSLQSNYGSADENDPSGPSLPPTKEQNQRAAAADAAHRAKLPSLLPLPANQTRPSYYASSSEWMGSDTVFKDGDGSQQSLLCNYQDASSFPAPSPAGMPPMGGDGMMMAPLPPMMTITEPAPVGVPFFSPDEYDQMVNKNADYSQNVEGIDLPDKATTRFFYNLGLNVYKNNGFVNAVHPPPAEAVPMPPQFLTSPPPMPPPSPVFFPNNFQMFPPAGVPPNTPYVNSFHSLPPHLAQYAYPNVEGMPTYVYGDGSGGQMIDQGPMNSGPAPAPLMNGSTQIFFPPNN